MIFSCNLVKTLEIDAKVERTILLFYEKDGSSMRRGSGTNKTNPEMFVDEFAEGG